MRCSWPPSGSGCTACCLRPWTQCKLGIQRAQACTRRHFAFVLCCHGNATRAPITNPPNSARLGGIPYHFAKLHPGWCNSVGMRPQTATQTDTQTRETTIHFASSITHAKCNKFSESINSTLVCCTCYRPSVQKLCHVVLVIGVCVVS